MRWQNALSFFCQSVLQTSEIVYGSKLKIYVGNWTEEQFVISTLCFLTIISNYLPTPVIWRVINQLPASTKPYEFSLSWLYFFCCSWYLLTIQWNYFWRYSCNKITKTEILNFPPKFKRSFFQILAIIGLFN